MWCDNLLRINREKTTELIDLEFENLLNRNSIDCLIMALFL